MFTSRYQFFIFCNYAFIATEQINYILYKEDVYNELINHPLFSGYTIEQCSLDLDSFQKYKLSLNLNKKYRFELSQYSIEIERLTLRLENLKVEGASLEPSLLERI